MAPVAYATKSDSKVAGKAALIDWKRSKTLALGRSRPRLKKSRSVGGRTRHCCEIMGRIIRQTSPLKVCGQSLSNAGCPGKFNANIQNVGTRRNDLIKKMILMLAAWVNWQSGRNPHRKTTPVHRHCAVASWPHLGQRMRSTSSTDFSLEVWRACRPRCMELNGPTHPCWTWHWCFFGNRWGHKAYLLT